MLEQDQRQEQAAKDQRENSSLGSQEKANSESQRQNDFDFFPAVKIDAILFGGLVAKQEPRILGSHLFRDLRGRVGRLRKNGARQTQILNRDQSHQNAAPQPDTQKKCRHAPRMHYC